MFHVTPFLICWYLCLLWCCPKIAGVPNDGSCFRGVNNAQHKSYPPSNSFISFHFGHAMDFTVVMNGTVLMALELSRLPNVSYHWMPTDAVTQRFKLQVWDIAWPILLHAWQTLGWRPPEVFETLGIDCIWFVKLTSAFWQFRENDWQYTRIEQMLHHHGHAAYGFYDSPFDNALVISMDGGGWDGTFQIYRASRKKGLELVGVVRNNYGYAYGIFSMTRATRTPTDLMSLSVAGLPRYKREVGHIYKVSNPFGRTDFYNIIRINIQKLKKVVGPNIKDYAASVQDGLETRVIDHIKEHLRPDIEGLVLTGGVALNARLNSKVQDTFNLPVHVPPEPGDEGLGIGWAWLLHPPDPKDTGQPFTGLPIIDRALLPTYAAQRGAAQADADTVGSMLAEGKIVGLVRGRAAICLTRGLGHRNIIAATHVRGMANRLRQLVGFKPFRYVGVIATDVAATELFNGPVKSPYMSFTPILKNPKAHPEMCLRDGSVLLQTITPQQDAWLYAVLTRLGSIRGVAAVLSADFFTGTANAQKPPAYVDDALGLLHEASAVDAVVVEQWLFQRKVAS